MGERGDRLYARSSCAMQNKNFLLPIFNALAKDISPDGVWAMSNLIQPLGTLLRIEIELPKHRKIINATGAVYLSLRTRAEGDSRAA
jgi:hypothetical protein